MASIMMCGTVVAASTIVTGAERMLLLARFGYAWPVAV